MFAEQQVFRAERPLGIRLTLIVYIRTATLNVLACLASGRGKASFHQRIYQRQAITL